MKRKSAVLIFEGPWRIYDNDVNRSSVLPFFEGMAKQFDNVEIIYSRYYDLHSFRAAFAELSNHAFGNAIVYVAGHGDGQRVSGAKILDILVECSVDSERANITGVVLGSCFSAGTPDHPQNDTINHMIQESRIAWIAAYKCASYWFQSTLLDLAIINTMLGAREKDFGQRANITRMLARAISPFSPGFELGDDSLDEDEADPVSLGDGLAFFSQPRGQGHKAREVTDEVWQSWKLRQLDPETSNLS